MKLAALLACLVFALSGCTQPSNNLKSRDEAGHWKNYSVTWIDDECTQGVRGFYLFRRTPDNRTSDDLSEMSLVGNIDGVELWFVHDSCFSSRKGFYAVHADGVWTPTTTYTASVGKHTAGYGQIILESTK